MALREDKMILIFYREAKGKAKVIGMKIGDTIKVDHRNLSLEIVDKRSIEFSNSRNTEYVDAEKISDKCILRPWKNGDAFYPLGMNGSKKVSDFLNSQKVSASKKRNQLVLTNKNKIIWIVGYRIDNRYKVTNKTRKVLKLCLK